MPLAVESQRLCSGYQPFRKPRTAAFDARLENLRMTPPSQGTNGIYSLYPFWGRLQDVREGFAEPLNLYLAALAGAAAAVAGGLIATGYSLGNPWVVGGLAFVAAVAERSTVRLSKTLEDSVALLPTIFAAVLFGPLAGLIVAAASMLGDFRPPYLKWGIYTSSRALTGAVAGGFAYAFGSSVDSEFGGVALATTASALSAEGLGFLFVAITLRLRGRANVLDVAKTTIPAIAASIPLYAPLVAILAFAYTNVSGWTLPLFFVPALAAQRLYVMYQQQRMLAEDLVAANTQLERANLSFASALVATLDARDRYTAGHSAAVAVYARDIAARMGLSEDEERLVHLCGLVHDIGKIGLPPGLLEKPGALTLDERRQMEKHSEIGQRILAKVEGYQEIARIVRHHHERIDGEGYPDRIRGDQIPVLSRIISVADAYNAMTSDRPYRDAMPSRVARLRLAQAVESQFDTNVVAAFEAILAGATEEYRSGHSLSFDLEADEHPELGELAAASVA
jgi:putative nucleotidyltransferase with HDIG domain